MPKLRTCLLHLAIGAALSVTTAWVAVPFSKCQNGAGVDSTLYLVSPVDTWPRNADELFREDSLGLTVIRAVWHRSTPTTGVSWEYTAQFAGFPFDCLMSERMPVREDLANPTQPIQLHQGFFDVGIRLPSGIGTSSTAIGTNDRFLPVKPVWLGLYGDSIILGAASLAVCRSYVKLRAALRRRRGECPACRYPQFDVGPCPECGAIKRAA